MANKTDPADPRFMAAALTLSRRGLGRVWPNPSVGCVLVRDGRVVGRGWTQPGGRPHAETEALDRAREAAKRATVYVTLEPCTHQGETPPCADALIEAGVARAVVALEDPDPRVGGGGVERLRAAGISVELGVGAARAEEINAGYLMRVRRGRPLVTLKVATTLDGRVATRPGESRWITGGAARARAHLFRAETDAIVIGIGTALMDDPRLTCRLPGLEDRSPVRIVIDGRLRLPPSNRLVAEAGEVPTWLVVLRDAAPDRRQAYLDAGVEFVEVEPDADGRPDPDDVLRRIGERGVTRVLVEGGSFIAGALLRAGLVDRLAWFRAPGIIGGDGIPVAVALGVERPDEAPTFTRLSLLQVGDDLLETYAPKS